MMDFYDFDPDSEESRQRIITGFTDLVAKMQAVIDADRLAAAERHRAILRRSNAFWDAMREKEKTEQITAPSFSN